LPDNSRNPVLGIDLGTTYSAIAKWDGRGARVIQNILGQDTTPSVVFYDKNAKSEETRYIVGKLAYQRGITRPENVIIGVKRLMDNRDTKIKIEEFELFPIDVSSIILKSLYSYAFRQVPGFRSRGVVVSVPYYFKSHQCENTREAAEKGMTGIPILGIIQEPIAASLSYSWNIYKSDPDKEREENILIFDLGGGTFDLTLFKLIQQPKKLLFEVLGTGGDDRLGGMDFDKCIIDYVMEKEKLDFSSLEPKQQKKSMQKLIMSCIEAKHALAAIENTYIFIADVMPGIHIEREFDRNQFEECIGQYFKKIENYIDDIFSKANFDPYNLDRVLLVGGSSKIPKMRELLGNKIGQDKVWADVSADLCVVNGAAMYAAYLDDQDIFDIGIEIKTRTCHALGVEVSGGRFWTIIPANAKTPSERRETFTTFEDDATELELNVYQGSSKSVANNSHIGTINIENLPPKPAGDIDIEVIFKLSDEQAFSVIVKYEIDGEITEIREAFRSL